MNVQRPIPARTPRQLASALMLWLATLLSVAAGVQPVAPPDLAQVRQMSADAARAGDLPAQRSTEASLQARLALVSDRALEAVAASGDDGPDAALPKHPDPVLPADRAAQGDRPLAAFARAALPAGFRARAPPILA